MTAILIRNSERVAFIGATGSGKTVLARYLLSGLNRVVVIDPKHMFHMPGYKPGWRLPLTSGEFHLVIRPAREDDDRLAGFLMRLMREGSVTIYCDEAATTADIFPETTQAMTEIARTGRERHVGLWCTMQRPRRVPLTMLTETETFFVFSVRSKDDRDYIRGYTGDEVSERLPRFAFWYYRTEEDRPALLTLNLKENQVEEFNQEVEEDVG
jgi:ABC-type dipeptide/oligopeptide/nickel transport system ATPase component